MSGEILVQPGDRAHSSEHGVFFPPNFIISVVSIRTPAIVIDTAGQYNWVYGVEVMRSIKISYEYILTRHGLVALVTRWQ